MGEMIDREKNDRERERKMIEKHKNDRKRQKWERETEMIERDKNLIERERERERGKRRKGLFQLKCEHTFQSLVRQSFRLEGLSSWCWWPRMLKKAHSD